MNRTYRIYRDLGLQLRNETPKRRVTAKLREDRCEATQPNETWAMDFVHDQLATGKKIRVLTVVDTFSRYVPVLDPRYSYRAEDVVRTLEQGLPQDRLSEDDPRRFGLGASRSTSADRESQPTTPTSKRSTAASGRSV